MSGRLLPAGSGGNGVSGLCWEGQGCVSPTSQPGSLRLGVTVLQLRSAGRRAQSTVVAAAISQGPGCSSLRKGPRDPLYPGPVSGCRIPSKTLPAATGMISLLLHCSPGQASPSWDLPEVLKGIGSRGHILPRPKPPRPAARCQLRSTLPFLCHGEPSVPSCLHSACDCGRLPSCLSVPSCKRGTWTNSKVTLRRIAEENSGWGPTA